MALEVTVPSQCGGGGENYAVDWVVRRSSQAGYKLSELS